MCNLRHYYYYDSDMRRGVTRTVKVITRCMLQEYLQQDQILFKMFLMFMFETAHDQCS